MIEFFQSLVHYIDIFVNFLVTMFTNLMQLLWYIPQTYIALGSVSAMLPPFIMVPIMAVLALSVLVAILNKWG